MKRKNTYLFFLILSLLFSYKVNAQYSFVSDTSIIKWNIERGEKLTSSKIDSSIIYSEKAIEIIERHNIPSSQKTRDIYIKLKSTALNSIGYALKNKADYQSSIQYFRKSLYLVEKIKYKEGIVAVRLNMAIAYRNLGDLNKAIEENFNALRIAEKLNQERNMANIYNNLGLIYFSQTDYKRAIDYYEKSAILKEKLGLNSLLAVTYTNIGLAYKTRKEYEKALKYYHKANHLSSNEDKVGMSNAINNLGVLYLEFYERDSIHKESALQYIDSAEKCFYTSSVIQQSIGDKKGYCLSLCNLSTIYQYKKLYPQALDTCLKGFNIAKQINSAESIRNAASLLKKIYNSLGDFEKAYSMYWEFKNARDSVTNEIKRKASEKQQLKYEWENKEARLKAEQCKKNLLFESTIALNLIKHKNEEDKQLLEAEQEKEQILNEEKAKRLKEEQLFNERKLIALFERQQKQKLSELEEMQLKQVLVASLIGGFLLLTFTFIVYKRFKQTKTKQKIIKEQQKELSIAYHKLHDYNKEIMDSINYAARIQRSLIPSEKYISQQLIKLKKKV